MRYLLPALIMTTLLAAIHTYLWHRLFKAPAWGWHWSLIGAIVLSLLALSVVAAMVLQFAEGFPEGAARLVATVAFVWMGALLLFAVSVGAADLLRWLVHLCLGERAGSPIMWTRGAALVGALSASALSIVALIGASSPALKRIDIPVTGLPASLRGFTILQLSDLHVSSITRREWVSAVVERANALNPDIVAITGDLVDGSVEKLAHDVAPLAGLKSRLGVYFTTGNHEYYSGAGEWLRHLPTLGIRTLQNELVELEGLPIDLVGIPDATGASTSFTDAGPGPDLAKAMARHQQGRVAVLMAHQPTQCRGEAMREVDLALSGHTHGGQIWPFMYLVKLQQPFVSGLYRLANRSWLYVSNGTGTWGPPMRLGAPSELTLLTLVEGGDGTGTEGEGLTRAPGR